MDNHLINEEARTKLLIGANKIAETAVLTLGPAGAAAVIESPLNPGHKIVDDGVSVAKAIHLDDKYENMGAKIMQEIAGQADSHGDGTTTAMTIARSIINEGSSLKMRPQQLKAELDECLAIITKEIDDQKETITPEEVNKVATTSSNDPALGSLLQEIYQRIGATGIVELDNSNLPTTYYDLVDGVRFRGAGYLGAYSSTEPGKAVYHNPRILISREKITSVNQIEPLVSALVAKGIHELVLVVDEIDMAVASRLALTHLQGQFKTLIIKMPVLFKDWLFEDMAEITGATPVNKAEGKTFATLQMSDLGTCDTIISTPEETRIIGIKDISAHIATLKNMVVDDSNIQQRLSWLQTKAAILKMGANSEAELSTKRAKAIDAISACHHALEDGVVVGGGRTLASLTAKLPNTEGGKIMKLALEAPLKQMEENMGHEMPNAQELKAQGVLDPAKVVKNSVKSAVSVAGSLLSTKIIITHYAPPSQMPQLPQA